MKTFRQFISEARGLDIIDNRKGVGQVPWNIDVDYEGVRVLMKPSVFLNLATPIPSGKEKQKTIKHVEDILRDGGKIGAPFLIIEYKENGLHRVTGHEGRHRMMAVRNLYGDKPLETHLFLRRDLESRLLRKIRGKEITKEMLDSLNSGIKQQTTDTWRFSPLFKKM
jgi:hypothetical protein